MNRKDDYVELTCNRGSDDESPGKGRMIDNAVSLVKLIINILK